MDDSLNFINSTCKLLNGEHEFDALKEMLSIDFPEQTPYLENLLIKLDSEYLLEDNLYNHSSVLTDTEKSRWSRNIEFFASYCKADQNKYAFQETLKSTKVAIFGLGGVGSNILLNLAAMGIQNIRAIDFDKVELSNLNRQIIYDESDIGSLKSTAAKKKLNKFAPNSNFEFINKKINCSEDISELINGYDIVISAIDHPREFIMEWFNVACVENNIPFITGSLDSKVAICYTIIPGKTGCIECWKNNANKSGFVFQQLVQHKNFVSSHSPNVAIMPLISIVSGLVSSEILKIITGIAEPQSLGKMCTFDFLTSQITTTENWKRAPDCLICRAN
jgi:thiazole/oxazole-forming peptide maturase SagC family component